MKTRATSSLTIGCLTPNMVEGNGRSLWRGIKEEAQARGIRLVNFAGVELQHPKPFFHQANQVYELVDREQLDGLIIWSSSLASFIGREGFKVFYQHYLPLPMVGIGMPFAGIPSVLLDSYQGMRAVLTHLVQVHGKRQIAFICGPEPGGAPIHTHFRLAREDPPHLSSRCCDEPGRTELAFQPGQIDPGQRH